MQVHVPEIDCPVRKVRISSLVCHTCNNHIDVLFKSECPPELQCSMRQWEGMWTNGKMPYERYPLN